MFGALFGDVIGSYYEVHCTKNYSFPLVYESTFTDDSVLTAAVCESILKNPDEISRLHLLRRADEFAAEYRIYYSRYSNAGFGEMFSSWAKGNSGKYNKSYGNGAAMRVVPIGYAYKTLEQTLIQAKASCIPTHKNREAIVGASAVCMAVFLARSGESKDGIRKQIKEKFGFDLSKTVNQIKKDYVFDSRTSYSVPPAIISFLDSDDYESAVRNAVSLGGDADTQACIAGGIAEAFYGVIPDNIKKFCEPRIDISLKNIVRQFENKYNIK